MFVYPFFPLLALEGSERAGTYRWGWWQLWGSGGHILRPPTDKLFLLYSYIHRSWLPMLFCCGGPSPVGRESYISSVCGNFVEPKLTQRSQHLPAAEKQVVHSESAELGTSFRLPCSQNPQCLSPIQVFQAIGVTWPDLHLNKFVALEEENLVKMLL